MGSHSANGTDDITLFSSIPSPFTARVRIALREKNIPYRLVTIDYENKPKELLEANPFYATVPTLIHNGTPILESTIILEYLDEAFPSTVPLLPKDPILRAKFRFYTDFIYRNFPFLPTIAKSQAETPEREAAIGYLPGFLRKLNEIMTEFSPEGPFFTGSKFTYLDVVLAPLTSYRLFVKDVLGVPLPSPDEIPRFGNWVAAVKARESVKTQILTPEEGKEVFGKRFEMLTQKFAESLEAGSKN